jgi:hypothetical protein
MHITAALVTLDAPSSITAIASSYLVAPARCTLLMLHSMLHQKDAALHARTVSTTAVCSPVYGLCALPQGQWH